MTDESRQVRRARERFEAKHPPASAPPKPAQERGQLWCDRGGEGHRVVIPAAGFALAMAALGGGYRQ